MPLIEQTHKIWTNERGNLVRPFTAYGIGSRYVFDFNLHTAKDGWKQYDTDQDASYFGIWVHLEDRKIATFAEGDYYLVECPDDEHLKAELEDMAEFYGPPPPAFRVIDLNGNITKIYDTRSGIALN